MHCDPPLIDDNRLVLNVSRQKTDKSKAFQNKLKLTLGSPPILAGIIKRDSGTLLAALSGLVGV